METTIINKENLGDMPKYTISQLIDDIAEEISCDNTNVSHERIYKMKVIQSIFDLNLNESTFNILNKKELEEKIDRYVDENEQLFGYTFFLSANPNFNYTWTFLRKRMKDYKVFLLEVSIFIRQIVDDINTMLSTFKAYTNLEILFNEILCVKFLEKHPYIKSSINWEKFEKIVKIKQPYYISAKLKNEIILTTHNTYGNKPLSFINNVVMLITTWKKSLSKTEETK